MNRRALLLFVLWLAAVLACGGKSEGLDGYSFDRIPCRYAERDGRTTLVCR